MQHPEGNSEVGQPIIFGMARECLAKANIAAKEGRQYERAEIMSADPFFIDREVLEVHPFLPLWKEAVR